MLQSLAVITAFAAQVLAYGGVVESPSRNTVGAATTAACGAGVANYLSKNPAANLQDIAAHKDSGYNEGACSLNLCKGYQFADSPASKIATVTTSQVINITVDYTIPTTPIDSRDYYNLYTPELAIVNASSGYALWSILGGYSLQPGTSEVLTHPSIETLNAYGLGDFPERACSNKGDCFLTYHIVDYFRQPTLVSSRILDSGCLDITIDWSQFEGDDRQLIKEARGKRE